MQKIEIFGTLPPFAFSTSGPILTRFGKNFGMLTIVPDAKSNEDSESEIKKEEPPADFPLQAKKRHPKSEKWTFWATTFSFVIRSAQTCAHFNQLVMWNRTVYRKLDFGEKNFSAQY